MRYKSFKHVDLARFFKVYDSYSCFIDNKWESIRSEFTYTSSERERFVDKFFHKYIGKYIVLIDKVLTATIRKYGDNTFFSSITPVSKYSADFDRLHYGGDKEIIVNKKMYLHIENFINHNKMYGGSYITMECTDVMGNHHSYKFDMNNLAYAQFEFIDKKDFDAISSMFLDDREDEEYEAERYLSYEEMVAGKYIRKNCSIKKIPMITVKEKVVAKDKSDAYNKLESVGKYNVITIERV